MPRVSKAVKDAADKHERTMKKYPNFNMWAKKHLQNKALAEDLEKAFNYLQGGSNDEEATESRPDSED